MRAFKTQVYIQLWIKPGNYQFIAIKTIWGEVSVILCALIASLHSIITGDYFTSVACKPLTTRSLHKRKMADPRICLGNFVSQVTVFSLKDVHSSAENWQIIFREFSLLFSQSHADPPSSLSSLKMSVKQIL